MPVISISSEPSVSFSPLYGADGSATFSQNGYTVIGSVNGPIEITRRDELSEEAAIDVVVRPAVGAGGKMALNQNIFTKLTLMPGTRERHLESIIQSTLRQLILIQNYPRTLIQVTLQITETPANETSSPKLYQASSVIELLSQTTC